MIYVKQYKVKRPNGHKAITNTESHYELDQIPH
jgi:hypothetical protein